MNTKSNKVKVQPTRGSSNLPTARSTKPYTTPIDNPDSLLKEARKKARAIAKGLAEDNRPQDSSIAQELNSFSFNAIDTVIAEQESQTSYNPAVNPTTIIPTPPILSHATHPVNPTPPILSHAAPHLLDTQIDTSTHLPEEITTLERIPAPFLRETDECLPGNPPRLTFDTARLAFPSMNSGEAVTGGEGERLTMLQVTMTGWHVWRG